MKLGTRHPFTFPLALAIGLIACAHKNAGTTTTTAAPPPPPEMGALPPAPSSHQREVAFLANARCEHQQACNNVGAGKQFVTEDACVKQVQSEGLSEEYRRQCPGAIDAQRLQTCASAIKASSCTGGAPDAMNRFEVCSVSSLCPSMNTP
jgi:hypothetical protein